MTSEEAKREPGKATLLAILNEVKAGREDVKAAVTDHEDRIRVLERKNMKVSAVVSGIVSVIVALATLFAGGCAHSKSANTLSREATIRVDAVGITDFGFGAWAGTGWYIATDGQYSVIATAGHVCEGSSITTLYGTSDGHDAVVIYDHDESQVDDTCLLLVKGAHAPLSIGGVPAGDAKVTYTGYPNGTRGTYHGEVAGVRDNGVVDVSVPAYFGSSGSAVLDDSTGKVIGMLVTGDTEFTHHASLVGSAALHRAQDFAKDYLKRLRADPWDTVVGTLVTAALDTGEDN